jgi:hypothetical protein
MPAFTLHHSSHSPRSGLIVIRRDALGEDPELSFGIGGCESAISCGRQLEIGDLSASVCRSLVKHVDVIDVDMDHRGRECTECPWAGEAFGRLAHHDQSVITEHKLVVCSTRGASLRKAKPETEALLKELHGCCGVLVQDVRRDTRIPRRRTRHAGSMTSALFSGPTGNWALRARAVRNVP